MMWPQIIGLIICCSVANLREDNKCTYFYSPADRKNHRRKRNQKETKKGGKRKKRKKKEKKEKEKRNLNPVQIHSKTPPAAGHPDKGHVNPVQTGNKSPKKCREMQDSQPVRSFGHALPLLMGKEIGL